MNRDLRQESDRPAFPVTQIDAMLRPAASAPCPEAETSIPARFQQLAARHPARMALGGGRWQFTYEQLEAATNRLAYALIARNSSKGGRVALLLRHDAPLFASALAILKAGQVVVVLNPSEPPARLKQILDDAEPHTLITDAANENLASQFASAQCHVLSFEKQNTGPVHPSEIDIAPADLAWLIYTSGSTGQPKGVRQTHRAIVHNILRLTGGLDVKAGDRILLLNSPSSGQGVSTTLCALLNGATLFPFPVMEKGMAGLKSWLLDHQISIWVSSTSVFRSFVKTLDPADRFPDLRVVRFASEPAAASDLTAVWRHFSGPCVVLNSLSSSETGNILQRLFTREETIVEGRLSVGWPAAGLDVRLVDEAGRELSGAETGEMIIRSQYLSPGYWRQDELTAARFFAEADGVRAFRSGDLARRLPDGSFIFMDRRDARVKVHGYKVELSEIENVLLRQPEIEQVLVSTDKASDGEIQILAHLITRNGQNCTASDLREKLRAVLPHHMVPAHFIFLEKFPLNAHGKIDREKLRQLALSVSPVANAAPGEAPATPAEVLLAGIWRKVFNRPAIGRHEDFFDLGGDSLNATVVVAHIHAALGVELPLGQFTSHATLAKMAALIDTLPRSKTGIALSPLVRAARDEPLPLSFVQERTWKYCRSAEGALGYTMAARHQLTGPLDLDVFRATLDYLSGRHEILRTTFHEVGGRPVQKIHAPAPVKLEVVDYRSRPDGKADATALLLTEIRRGFDLEQGPLLRFILVRLGENKHWLLRVSHHLICDGWSWNVYFRELTLIYEARLQGHPVPLPAVEPLQYADHAAHERRTLDPAGPAYREQVDWWARIIGEKLPPLRLPFQRKRPEPQASAAAGIHWWGLDPAVTERLASVAREHNITHYTIRLAAFAALLSDATVRNAPDAPGDLVLGTYVTGRDRVETQSMFGDFANLATLRLGCDPQATFRDSFQAVHQKVDAARAHAGIPYQQLQDELRSRGLTRPELSAIFSVSTHTAPLHFGGLAMTWLERPQEYMPWGFCLAMDQHNEHRQNRLAFDPRLHHPARVRQWLGHFQRLLDLASQYPDWTVGRLVAASRPSLFWKLLNRLTN